MSTRFVVDPERSIARVEMRSNVHTITAAAIGITGFFEVAIGPGPSLDLSHEPVGQIVVPIADLSSGNVLYDREMRRRASLRLHPTVVGALNSVRAMDQPPNSRYVIGASIAFRDAAVPAENEVSVQFVDDDTVQVDGSHVFDIRDFGIEPPSLLMLKVSPDVEVTMRIVAERAG